MANLKLLRDRISNIQSTSRVISAMKVISSAKLAKSKNSSLSNRVVHQQFENMIKQLRINVKENYNYPLFNGSLPRSVLLLVIGSDNGLAGSFNSYLFKKVDKFLSSLTAKKVNFSLITVGKKMAAQAQHRELSDKVIHNFNDLLKPRVTKQHAHAVTDILIDELLNKKKYDSLVVFYNQFVSNLVTVQKIQQILPLKIATKEVSDAYYDVEPQMDKLLPKLLRQYLFVQTYYSLQESFLSEQSVRMFTMDNAKRNADELNNFLKLDYNRIRQAKITQELIEIIASVNK